MECRDFCGPYLQPCGKLVLQEFINKGNGEEEEAPPARRPGRDKGKSKRPGGVGKGAVPRWRPAAKAKKKPRAEDGDDARRAGLQEKLARLRRRLLGTEEGKEEKVIDVEEDGDVAAEEQELDSVEEVGRLPTTALTRETMESPRRAGRREKRQKEKDNGKAKALVKLLEGKQEKKKKKEKKCTKKKKRVKKESPSGDSCPGSSGPSSPAQRCWHLSKSARQRGRAQS